MDTEKCMVGRIKKSDAQVELSSLIVLIKIITHDRFEKYGCKVRDITKLSGYPRSNVKIRIEQSNYYLASGRFPLQNAIYGNKLPFSQM